MAEGPWHIFSGPQGRHGNHHGNLHSLHRQAGEHEGRETAGGVVQDTEGNLCRIGKVLRILRKDAQSLDELPADAYVEAFLDFIGILLHIAADGVIDGIDDKAHGAPLPKPDVLGKVRGIMSPAMASPRMMASSRSSLESA